MENESHKSVSETSALLGRVKVLTKKALEHREVTDYMERVVAFTNGLKNKYPDYLNWRAYHALVGSSIPSDTQDVIEDDFPGEDSVIDFLESLAGGGKNDQVQ